MRHRRRGRTLGRSPSHRKALFKNLASALFLTERDATLDDNAPKTPGRITTTLHKAKEVRPLVEKCITIAKKSLAAAEEAKQFETSAERDSDEYKQWRKSEERKKKMPTTVNNTTVNSRITIIFDADGSLDGNGPAKGTGNTESDVYLDSNVYHNIRSHTEIDANVHALQWNATTNSGELEYTDLRENQSLSSFPKNART